MGTSGTLFGGNRRFVLSNRFNLLRILGSGVVAPRSSYVKYYNDPLSLSDGNVVLAEVAEGQALPRWETEPDDPAAFRVAIELKPDALEGLCTEEGPDGLIVSHGALPSSSLAAVVFASQAELAEHVARKYENIPTESVDLTVEEALFAPESVTVDQSWLAEHAPERALDVLDYEAADRLAGSMVALLAAAALPELRNPEIWRSLASILNGSPLDADSAVPSWLSSTGQDDDSRKLMELVLDVVGSQQRRRSWLPVELGQELGKRAACLRLEDSDSVAQQTKFMVDVLDNVREFRPFTLGHGSAVLKAALLVLMHPELRDLLSLDWSETGLEADVVLTAAYLSGHLKGLASMDASVKTASRLAFGGCFKAKAINSAANAGASSCPQVVAVIDQLPDGSECYQLTWDGALLADEMVPAPTLGALLEQATPLSPERRDALTAVLAGEGWFDCLSATVRGSSDNLRLELSGSAFELVAQGQIELVYDIDYPALSSRLENTHVTKKADMEFRDALIPKSAKPVRKAKPRKRTTAKPKSQQLEDE